MIVVVSLMVVAFVIVWLIQNVFISVAIVFVDIITVIVSVNLF
jgi:hypothetical protein